MQVADLLALRAEREIPGKIALAQIDVTRENARANAVAVSACLPEALAPGRYDVLVANILAQPLIALAPLIAAHTERARIGQMVGGIHYRDPGIRYISYFNGGDAIHAFNRASFGTPQSLGCVELPLTAAAKVWPYTPIGTLVTVEK